MSLTHVQNFSISLDGFGTGDGLSLDAPFGHAGERLHEWMFATRWGRTMFGGTGGGVGMDDAFARQAHAAVREPPAQEGDERSGLCIEPLHVVDGDDQGGRLGQRPDQRDHRGRDDVRVSRDGSVASEQRRAQRDLLHSRKCLENVVAQRVAQINQGRADAAGLGLGRASDHDLPTAPAGRLDHARPVEGLADAGRSFEYQDPRLVPDGIEFFVEPGVARHPDTVPRVRCRHATCKWNRGGAPRGGLEPPTSWS